jgi:hypothetical protein
VLAEPFLEADRFLAGEVLVDELFELSVVVINDPFSLSFAKVICPDMLSRSLGPDEEALESVGPDRITGTRCIVYDKLQVSEQVGMAQLVPTSQRIVLGTIAVMDKTALEAFTKASFDGLVVSVLGDGIVAGSGILPDPFPDSFARYTDAGFVTADA